MWELNLKIVYLGDVVARSGREKVIQTISVIKNDWHWDALIVNVDNAAHGFGCTPKIARQFFEARASALVTGDHVWDQKDFTAYLNESNRIVRPLNYSDNLAGVGARVIPLDNGQKLLIAEVVGRVFMAEVASPLEKLEQLLTQYKLTDNVDAIFVDIHAEATAEKQALAHYFDGKISAIIGSHTHIPTADAMILPQGTAYQTDVGMCGDCSGVIGFKTAAPIARLKNPASNLRLEPGEGQATIHGVFIETDDKSGLAVKIVPLTY